MSSSANDDVTEQQQPQLAARETKRVNLLKILVIVSLVVAAAAVAGLTYTLTSSQEQQDFEGDVSIRNVLFIVPYVVFYDENVGPA